MNCDASSLILAAKNFQRLSKGSVRGVLIYLLCQWAKKKLAP